MDENSEKSLHFRKLCLDELLSSEESYLHHLSLLKEFFINPILERDLLPYHLFNNIFGNVTPIQTVNARLHEELRRHYSTDTIGQGFLLMFAYLKIYATYAKNLEQAQLTLTNYETKNKSFKKFRVNQECRPELGGLKLNSLLITPIQRVPRYKLLLHEIIRYTPESHHDYKNLLDAEKAISDVALHINAHVRQTADIQAMLNLQRALTNSRPRIFIPGRCLIKYGTVKKLSKRGNGEQKRLLILFNDMIMYCKVRLTDIRKQDSLQCCSVMPLNDCSVSPVFGVIFKLCCKENEILFYATSACECDMWMEKIQNAISNYCDKIQTLKRLDNCKGPQTRKMFIKRKFEDLSVIIRDSTRKRAKRSWSPTQQFRLNATAEVKINFPSNPADNKENDVDKQVNNRNEKDCLSKDLLSLSGKTSQRIKAPVNNFIPFISSSEKLCKNPKDSSLRNEQTCQQNFEEPSGAVLDLFSCCIL